MSDAELAIRALYYIVRFLWRLERQRNARQGNKWFFVSFLKDILFFQVILFPLSSRMRLLIATYFWLSYVNDIVDEDLDLPNGLSRQSFIAQKTALIDAIPDLADSDLFPEDLLLVYILRLSGKRGMDFSNNIKEIWPIMLWDDQRRVDKRIVSGQELYWHAANQDYLCLEIFAKIFGGDLERLRGSMANLKGIVTRSDWLFDIDEDLSKGLVNVPSEAMNAYGINLENLLACKGWHDLRKIPGFLEFYMRELKNLEVAWREWPDKKFCDIFASRTVRFFAGKLANYSQGAIKNKLIRARSISGMS